MNAMTCVRKGAAQAQMLAEVVRSDEAGALGGTGTKKSLFL